MRLPHPIRSFVGHYGSTGKTGQTSQRVCRIRAGPASAADLESRTQAGAQPTRWGSDHHCGVRPVHARVPHLAFGHCCEAVHSAVFPQPAEETQVPHAVLTAARSSAWTKGPEKELIAAVVAMNPNRSCHRIAQQIALAFGVEIDKNVV